MEYKLSEGKTYDCLRKLEDEINESTDSKLIKAKIRTVGRVIHKFNSNIYEVLESNLSKKTKMKFAIYLKHQYKKSIFSNITKLTQNEKRWLNNFIVTKFRRLREIHLGEKTIFDFETEVFPVPEGKIAIITKIIND